MPDKPTLLDFFELRMGPATHLLQSATHALKAGCNEKVIMACLVHDIAVSMFIRGDHGYWGAQLLEPYVDEEVSWAIRAHQVLRFFPDQTYGYAYPELYIKFFGADYQAEPYIQRAYEKIRTHKWYETARLITVNDIYSFDQTMPVSLDPFRDIIARNFRQPEEGPGLGRQPVVAHVAHDQLADPLPLIDVHVHLHPPRLYAAIRRWFAERTDWKIDHPTEPLRLP